MRSFPGIRSSTGSGDREPAKDRAFWIPWGEYDPVTDGYRPHAIRLTPDGAVSDWSLDKEPLLSPPSAVRVDLEGTIWVLVPRANAYVSALYALGPADAYIRRFAVPFVATNLTMDPAQPTAWLSGPGWVGSVDNKNVAAIRLPHAAGPASRIDPATRQMWLAADDGSLIAFAIDRGYQFTYPDFEQALSGLDIDASGTVWGVDPEGTRLVSMDPAAEKKTTWPLVLTSGAWAAPGVGKGGAIALCSTSGPHVMMLDPAALPGAETSTLVFPQAGSTISDKGPITMIKPAADQQRQAFPPVDRVEYRETASGAELFRTEGVEYGTVLWSDGSEALTGTDPVQWWQPLDPAAAFETQAVLPVVVEVRPEDPSNNFRTELTIANVDADPQVGLVLTTASASYEVHVAVPAGGTVSWLDAMGALRALGAAVPAGAYGTLTATFTNGRGTMAARVYTLFADDTKLPRGSTSGLGFSSVDPASRLLTQISTLNGLKSTKDYRTNVALANVCGATGECAPLTMEVDFFDDATGTALGGQTVDVPPHGFVQLDGPLAARGATGETFSVQVKPASGGPSAYDAYATVISNVIQDASFVRAVASAPSRALTLPVVTDSAGIGTRFTSEAALTNSGEKTAVADVTFRSVPTGKKVTDVVTLPARTGIRWANAVDHFRALAPGEVAGDDYGTVTFAFRGDASAFVSSRTLATNGTGLALTALDPFRERASSTKRVSGLRQGAAVRTNLSVVHLGATTADAAAPVTVAITVRDPAGRPVGAPLVQTLVPGELHQFSGILERLGASGDGYTATVERTSGLDAFDAYATIIDNVSSDPTFLRAE